MVSRQYTYFRLLSYGDSRVLHFGSSQWVEVIHVLFMYRHNQICIYMKFTKQPLLSETMKYVSLWMNLLQTNCYMIWYVLI